ALAEYKAYLAKHPRAPDADEVRAKIERLQRKKQRWAFQEAMKGAAGYLKAHDYDEAQAAYSRALELEPGSPEALEGLKRVDALRAEYEEAMDRSLTVVRRQAEPKDPTEEAAYQRLLSAVAAGDHEAAKQRAEAFMERYPKSAFHDEAAYALASATALSGDRAGAKRLLKQVAWDHRKQNMGRRARLVLASQEFDRLGAFYAAQREHTRKQVQYALLGQDLARQNVDLGVYRYFVEGLKSIETLGMVNLLGATVRTVTLVSNDPIPNDPIIETGLRFSRNHPDAPEVKEVYYQIGRAYEREHKHIEALIYYRLSGRASKRKTTALRAKAAKHLLAQATMAPTNLLKARLYRAIIEHFPETKAVAKAKARLVVLARQAQDRFRLSRKYLLNHPEVTGPQGLNLDPRLLDGDISNKEMHEKGLVLLRGNRMKIFFTLPDGSESEQIFLVHPDRVARFEGLMRDLDRKRAYALAEKYSLEGPVVAAREIFAGTVAAEKRYNPFIVQKVNEISGNVYLSEDELRQYEETLYAQLGADISSDLSDLSTGGSLYFLRYGAGLQFGVDPESPNVGALIPLGPVDITTKMRATGLSVYPSLRLGTKPVPDAHLYK
ncbi:MAG: tetratricopeptide repeat protein, partial [Candidatus Tectimicrobiota bacterium]